jgi:hypothetical protein
MLDFGSHGVQLIWNSEDADPTENMPPELGDIQWDYYPADFCLCAYTKAGFWQGIRPEVVDTCSGSSCASKMGAYALVSDWQLETTIHLDTYASRCVGLEPTLKDWQRKQCGCGCTDCL